MARGPVQRTLTIYLVKEGVRDPGAIIRPGMDHHPVRFGRRQTGDLYVKLGQPHPPPWVTFFEGTVDDLTRVQGMTPSAILLLEAGRRLFAIAFGFGRLLLQPGVTDERFGLKVTLNAVDHTQIRSVDSLTLDSPAPHSQKQASRPADITQFGLDIDQDLLRAVTGNPRDPTLGKRLTGKDALRTTGAFTLQTIPGLLERYLAESKKTTYRDHFAWVDHIREVKDPGLRDALDQLVLERLQRDDLDRMWLAIPDLIDWQTNDGFTYSPAPSAERHDDIHLRAFLDHLRNPASLTTESLRRYRVYAISSDTDTPNQEWPVYQCLYAEVQHNEAQYLLNSGTWFTVDNTFRQRIERSFQRLPRRNRDLPNANPKEPEGRYNERVATADTTYALMDKRIIRYPDRRTQIELCDLYTKRRELIHVKRYALSGPLSHLFAQGLNSATMLAQDPGFRRAANNKLPATHQIPNPNRSLPPKAYTVTYAIISASNSPLNIPFFSKVTLNHATNQLHGLGYKTQLAKISTNP